MSTKQHPLTEEMTIPDSFWKDWIPHDAVMRYFGWTEPEFWAKYTSHQLPMGVNLQPLVKVPFVVFRLATLVEWENSGCPPQPGSAELLNEVLQSLKTACESEGVIFPDKAAEMN